MTTTAATSMISKNSTTSASLAAEAPTTLGGRRSDHDRSGDLDVDLVNARAGRCHAGVAVACGGERAQRPGPRSGEEPEVTGGRRDDLGGELVGRVQQTHERAADRMTRAVDNAAGDHRFLLEVDAGRQRQSLLRCRAHNQLPNSIGTPTREPYSVQLPS